MFKLFEFFQSGDSGAVEVLAKLLAIIVIPLKFISALTPVFLLGFAISHLYTKIFFELGEL